MKRCVLVLLCLLALPAGAEARPFNAGEMRAVELAHDYWKRGPACKQITLAVVPRAKMAPGADGQAWPCNIQVVADLPWVVLCTVVAHEWGHLLQGKWSWHSPTAGNIMSREPSPTPECELADNRRQFRDLRKRCLRKPSTKRKRCVRRARSVAFIGY